MLVTRGFGPSVTLVTGGLGPFGAAQVVAEIIDVAVSVLYLVPAALAEVELVAAARAALDLVIGARSDAAEIRESSEAAATVLESSRNKDGEVKPAASGRPFIV